VRVQVILHQTDGLGLGVVFRQQILHELGVIDGGAALPNFDIAKAGVGLEGQQDTTRAVFLILTFPYSTDIVLSPFRPNQMSIDLREDYLSRARVAASFCSPTTARASGQQATLFQRADP
jgi:hypothetical protein